MNKRKMTVRECKPVIEEAEFDKLLTQEAIAKEAVIAVESDGIVFIDEIDKIVSSSDSRHGAPTPLRKACSGTYFQSLKGRLFLRNTGTFLQTIFCSSRPVRSAKTNRAICWQSYKADYPFAWN